MTRQTTKGTGGEAFFACRDALQVVAAILQEAVKADLRMKEASFKLEDADGYLGTWTPDEALDLANRALGLAMRQDNARPIT